MDLFDIKLRLGVSGIHCARYKSTVLNVLIDYTQIVLIIPLIWKHAMFTIFSHVRSAIIIYWSFLPLIIRKIACFTVKLSFSCLNSMSKDERCRLCTNTERGCTIFRRCLADKFAFDRSSCVWPIETLFRNSARARVKRLLGAFCCESRR